MRIPRFTVRRMMAVIAGLAVLLPYLSRSYRTGGCGHASVPLAFQVVDDRTGQPIIAARIDLSYDYSLPPVATAYTDSAGDANLICEAGCTSYLGPFLYPYRVYWYSQGSIVSAPGYQTAEGLLLEFMKSPVYRDDRAPHPPIQIRLKPSSSN